MSVSDRILLIDDHFDMLALVRQRRGLYKAIICCFWIAPSTKMALSKAIDGYCYGVGDIIQNDINWGKAAFGLASQVVHSGPQYHDLAWRRYLLEPVYEECHLLHLLSEAAHFLETLRERWNIDALDIDGVLKDSTTSVLIQGLSKYPRLTYHSLSHGAELYNTQKDGKSLLGSLGLRLREMQLTRDWRAQAMDFVEWLDKKYAWRVYWGRWRHKPNVLRGGITFFSSYLNNSRTLASFVDSMPRAANWVISNDSARRGLPKGRCNFTWIWQFAQSFESSPKDEGKNPLNGDTTDHQMLKEWLTVSPTWQNWKIAELSVLAALTHCWEAYLDQAAPSLVVMANQWTLEGWFAEIARRRGIPVLQVMHGVLGGYLHTQTPITTDVLVVPGDFWRSLWPSNQQDKVIVFNPNSCVVKARRSEPCGKRHVTFFSWPLTLASFYNFTELMDGFIHVFHRLLSNDDVEVTVRVHPQENPADFVKRWKQLYGSLPHGIFIDKKKSLDQILTETDVALMFRSTVMLDCLVNNIPIVMPGWIDFGWNKALLDVPSVYLAHDFVDLEERLIVWLKDSPKISGEVADRFVRSPGADRVSFSSLINDLVSSGDTAYRPSRTVGSAT
jgi:hypothetical protein